MRIEFDADTLRPLVEEVVSAVMARLDDEQRHLGDKLAFTEVRAAELLGIPRHVLRDMRLRDEIKGKKAGKRIIYARAELESFLRKQ